MGFCDKQYLKENILIAVISLRVGECCGKRLYTNWNFPVKLLLFSRKPGIEDQAPRSCLPKIHWSLLHKNGQGRDKWHGKKPNVVKEAITRTIAKNKIDTVNETDNPQSSKSKKDKSVSNKSDKVRSLDK